jgi:hypothetical protein
MRELVDDFLVAEDRTRTRGARHERRSLTSGAWPKDVTRPVPRSYIVGAVTDAPHLHAYSVPLSAPFGEWWAYRDGPGKEAERAYCPAHHDVAARVEPGSPVPELAI